MLPIFELDNELEKQIEMESQILSIKNEILTLASAKGVDMSQIIKENDETQNPSTMELSSDEASLAKDLKATKKERKRLEKIGHWIATERDRLKSSAATSDAQGYTLPPWVANLDRSTIRSRIKSNLPANPEQLILSEKIAIFEGSAKEASELPKMPTLPRRQSFVKKSKEVAFAEFSQ